MTKSYFRLVNNCYCDKIAFFYSFCLSLCLCVQLTYADTHPMYTLDSYPNFFRVVPSESVFNQARVSLLRHFNWTRVGTLYQTNPRYALVSNQPSCALMQLLSDKHLSRNLGQHFQFHATNTMARYSIQQKKRRIAFSTDFTSSPNVNNHKHLYTLRKQLR